jgi:1-acyl-sn-glycerol-3-phosphate acyltransferase
MSRQNIKKYSWGYALVRFVTSFYHRLYYRKLILKYKEKIPVNKPVIYALNHQNALMDALAVVYTLPRQAIFMARADIFKKKMVASILYFLKILPAYRIRDGFHSVDQNKEVFKEVIEAMAYNRPFAILPEGNHHGEKRLRCLKKGAARLAFLAEEENGFNLGVSIVPVGIDYSNYYKAGSDLLIVFGDPIQAVDYREQYLENPIQAINTLTNDLAAAMRKVMLDIQPEEHYQTFYEAVEMYGPVELKKQKLKSTLWNSLRIKKDISEKLEKNSPGDEKPIQDLKAGLDSYRKKLVEKGIRDSQVAHPSGNGASLIFKICLSILLFPVHLYGMALNYLPYGLPIYLARNIKDRHFISSVVCYSFSPGTSCLLLYHSLSLPMF